MNYYEKHIGDYIRDTVSLTMLEDGAYNRLMDQYYQTERPLPLDKKMVYRLARANSTAERKAVDFVVDTFFTLTDSGYVQKRIDIEIGRYQEKQRKAQASANARWNKSDGNANASQTHDASDMRTHSVGNAHQTPDTSNQTPKEKPLSTSEPKIDPVTEIFGYWQKRMESPKSILDDKRKKAIKAALKLGYTEKQLCEAIRGCSLSPHHMGENERSTKYNSIDLIFRNADKIDSFIAMDKNPPKVHVNGSNQPSDMWAGAI